MTTFEPRHEDADVQRRHSTTGFRQTNPSTSQLTRHYSAMRADGTGEIRPSRSYLSHIPRSESPSDQVESPPNNSLLSIEARPVRRNITADFDEERLQLVRVSSRSPPPSSPIQSSSFTTGYSEPSNHVAPDTGHTFRRDSSTKQSGSDSRLVSNISMTEFRRMRVEWHWPESPEHCPDARHFDFPRGKAFPLQYTSILHDDDKAMVYACPIAKETHGFQGVVAIKMVKYKSPADLQTAKGEMHIYKETSHAHIAVLLATFTWSNFFGIILYPAAPHNLARYMRMTADEHAQQSGQAPYLLTSLRSMLPCLCNALRYLHSQRIKHRDIKPDNILVDKFGHVLLADFGISRKFEPTERSTTNTKKPPHSVQYAAPEVHKEGERTLKVDVFSLGCVFLEMATVLAGHMIDDLYQHVGEEGYEFYPRGLTLVVIYSYATPKIASWMHERLCRDESSSGPSDGMHTLRNHQLHLILGMMSLEPQSRPDLDTLVEKLGMRGHPCATCHETMPPESVPEADEPTFPTRQLPLKADTLPRRDEAATGTIAGDTRRSFSRNSDTSTFLPAPDNARQITTTQAGAAAKVGWDQHFPSRPVNANSNGAAEELDADNSPESSTYGPATSRAAHSQERGLDLDTESSGITSAAAQSSANGIRSGRDGTTQMSTERPTVTANPSELGGWLQPVRSNAIRVYRPGYRESEVVKRTRPKDGQLVLWDPGRNAVVMRNFENFSEEEHGPGIYMFLPRTNGWHFRALAGDLNLWRCLPRKVNWSRMVGKVRYIFIMGDFPEHLLLQGLRVRSG